MQNKVFLSTGGFKTFNTKKIINICKKKDIFNLEFSGGPYEKNVLKNLINLKKKILELNFFYITIFHHQKNLLCLIQLHLIKKLKKIQLNII